MPAPSAWILVEEVSATPLALCLVFARHEGTLLSVNDALRVLRRAADLFSEYHWGVGSAIQSELLLVQGTRKALCTSNSGPSQIPKVKASDALETAQRLAESKLGWK